MTDDRPMRDFEEDGALRASIGDTNLTVHSAGREPASYPLDAIVEVRRMDLPGGLAAVALWMDDRPASPGLTFRDPTVADEFFSAILDVVEERG